MADATELLDPEKLKLQEDLDDEQKDALREKILKEQQQEDSGEDEGEEENKTGEGEENEDKNKSAETDKEKNEEEEEEKPKEDEEEKEGEEAGKKKEESEELKPYEKALLEAKDEDLSEEEKGIKAELQERVEGQKEIEAKAETLSKEKNISLEDAKAKVISQRNILKKYDNDPEKLAKAVQENQSGYSKLENKVKELEEKLESGGGQQHPNLKPGEAIINGKHYTADQVRTHLIESYKQEKPKLTEDMDDEKVYQLAVEALQSKQEAARLKQGQKLAEKAEDVREKTLNELPEEVSEFKGDIATVLKNTPNEVLANPQWKPDAAILWARGKHYSNAKIKEIEQKAFKRGMERAQILGIKVNQPVTKTKPTSKTKPATSKLSEAEKERALSMYKSLDSKTDEEKYAMYLDYKKSVN